MAEGVGGLLEAGVGPSAPAAGSSAGTRRASQPSRSNCRWGEVAEIAGRLEGTRAGDLEATVLRARGHLARKEFAQARYLLDTAVGVHADAVWPRLVRSRVLLEERDEPAAEAALQDVLRIEPGNFKEG